jgi:hypothetical protein
MRNTLSVVRPQTGSNIQNTSGLHRRSLSGLLAPLNQMAAGSPNLVISREARFEVNGESYVLPRYLFIGPKSGDAPIRIGIFAAIHGDEPEGACALVRFLNFLENHPESAAGYCLSVYPVCNPTGFEDDTRHSRGGKDLNREFWRNSAEPEVNLLQAELLSGSFHGIISLHTDNTSEGFYGIVSGATLARDLLEPALKAASEFLPVNQRPRIDGFPARNGIVHESYKGILGAPPAVRSRPFEIVLETPKQQSAFLTDWAFIAALQTILVEYRKFIAYARNL